MRFWGLRLSLGIGMLCAATFPAHAVTWLPEFGILGRYDDNVLNRAEGSEDFVKAVIPGLTIFKYHPITSYELKARTSLISYSRTNVGTSRNDQASLTFDHRPGIFNQIEARGRYVRSVDPIDFQDGVVTTRGDVTNVFSRANADFRRVGAGIRHRLWDYDDSGLADGNAIDAAGRLYPIRTDITKGTLEIRRRELSIGSKRTLRADYQTFSLSREHSAMLSTEYTAGRVQVDYGAEDGSEVRPAVAFGVTRKGGDPEAPVTLRLRVADDIATTVEASIDVDRDGRSATLAWDTSVQADGGLYRVATLLRRGSATVRDTLYGGQVIDVGGSYGRTRALRGDGPEVNLWRAGAGISSPFGGWLTGRLGWDYLRQDNPESGAIVFDRSRFTLTLTAKPWQE